MAFSLSDEELRKKLKLLGEEVGPITSMTRRTYQRKLDMLLKKSSGRHMLNTLSSDDSEIEQNSPGDSNRRKKRLNHRTQTSVTQLNKLNISPTDKTKQSLPQQRDIFKKPFTSSPVANKTHNLRKSLNFSLGNSSFEMETSDSDADHDNSYRTRQSLLVRNHHVPERPKRSLLDIFPKPRSSIQANTPNGEDSYYSSSGSSRYSDSKRDYSKNFIYRESNSAFSERKYIKGNSVNGYATDVLNREFQNEKSRGKTTNYSHCVSLMLVFAVAALFIILGLFYVSAIQKTQFVASKNYLDSHICENNNNVDGCIPSAYFKAVLATSHSLHDLLSTVAGEFDCQVARATRNVTLNAARNELEKIYQDSEVEKVLPFDNVFEYTILLTQKNPDWGIRVFLNSDDSKNTLSVKSINEISALESKHAFKSLWCRLKHSIRWTVTKLLLLVLGIAFMSFCFIFLKFWRKRKEQQERQFYDLVEKVVDILQEPDTDERAVVHLRDAIIPLLERKEKAWLWEKVVSFIEQNESRVQVDYKLVNGEEHKIWRWLPSPAADMETGKHGKVWQGQAFSNQSKGKNHAQFCLTPCLKIRNMFDTEMEYGDDWQVYIQNAILEKCEGNNGIIHIAVDPNSSEGCVYVMCDCTRSAGKAFNALHGWWFDGKLVTVKYLRLQRYLERFPEAEDCTTPLKPSNNKRLSLSTPFFSSFLERS